MKHKIKLLCCGILILFLAVFFFYLYADWLITNYHNSRNTAIKEELARIGITSSEDCICLFYMNQDGERNTRSRTYLLCSENPFNIDMKYGIPKWESTFVYEGDDLRFREIEPQFQKYRINEGDSVQEFFYSINLIVYRTNKFYYLYMHDVIH